MLTSVFCVAPFNNPHITPLYDRLAEVEGLTVTRASWGRLPIARASQGWPEMAVDAPYLQPWRRAGDYTKFFRHLLSDKIVILPGFFHYKMLPFQHYIRRLCINGVTLLWSEPFLADPRTKRNPVALTIKRLLLRGADCNRYHLLTMGSGADRDYASLGVRRWRAWEFCFSIDIPPQDIVRDDHHGGPVKLLYVGSLVPWKEVDTLIRALADPLISSKGWKLTVVGGGPLERDLRMLADNAGLADKIDFCGAMDIGAARTMYGLSDILILPSRYDGWGAVINEAMESGLAVVASTGVGAARTIIEDGVDGLMFEAGDERQLAVQLGRLMDDRDYLRRMQVRSRDKIALYRPAEAARRLASLSIALAHGLDVPQFLEGPCRDLGGLADERS